MPFGGAAIERWHGEGERLDAGSPAPILNNMLNHEASLDLLFQSLADPARRGMVERLTRGPASVSELAAPLAMSLPAAMQHLRVLEASGLVRTEKAGRVRTCRIDAEALRTAERWIAARRASWERSLDRLGAFLDEPPPSSPDPGADR